MDCDLRDKLIEEGKCIACLEKPVVSGQLFCQQCQYKFSAADAKAMKGLKALTAV